MKRLPSLSCVFPAYNDARTLPWVLARADVAARNAANRYEIIVVNDGSDDATGDVLRALSKRFSKLRIITHAKNRGYGAAIRSGFRAARYAWIFYTDGDGQYNPLELKKLVSVRDEKTDVVNGYKISRSDPFNRKVLGSLYNFLLYKCYKLPIRDVDCDFRLIRSTTLRRIRLRSASGAFPFELILRLSRAGARFKEVPVRHYPRRHGTSQFFRPRHLFATLRELGSVR
jgi:glycosyltransferase involved in cell wall biosynthesis